MIVHSTLAVRDRLFRTINSLRYHSGFTDSTGARMSCSSPATSEAARIDHAPFIVWKPLTLSTDAIIRDFHISTLSNRHACLRHISLRRGMVTVIGAVLAQIEATKPRCVAAASARP